MSYTNVFSNNELPPSDVGLAIYTITADSLFTWPSYAESGLLTLASIVELKGSVSAALGLPPASQVSVGESVLFFNVGSATYDLLDFSGASVLTLAPGTAYLAYVQDNTSDAGVWEFIAYGSGTSEATAGTLAGSGLKAIGNKLAASIGAVVLNSNFSLVDANRASMLLFTGGATALSLPLISTLSTDFFCHIKNNGTGTLTITPYVGQTIDGAASLTVQPAESCILLNDGATAWVTVGLGRSTLYQYSNLTLDVSAGGTFTLTSAQAANKLLTFTGSPVAGVAVVVPGIVSVYYAANNLSTAQKVQVKTASDSGTLIGQSQRAVVLCDGASVTSAQTAPTTSVQSLLDGTVTAPSLNFAMKTNTGLYKFSTQGLGLTVNGVAQLTTNGTGVALPAGLTDSLNFLTTGARITGDFSNTTVASRVMFQTSTVNGFTSLHTLPNGASTQSQFTAETSSTDPANAAYAQFSADAATGVAIVSDRRGTGTYVPMNFYTGGAERVRIGTAGQLGIGGANYGTAGQVLTSSGPGAAPSWGTVSVAAGAVSYFATAVAPSGWLKANGALISRTTYAALFAVVGTTFGAGDGSTTFALPDLRGEFVRGWDDGRGVDAGRSLGASQTDAFQGHKHDTGETSYGAMVNGHGQGSTVNGVLPSLPQGTQPKLLTSVPVTDITNGTPRTATETRPRNVALLACIKF